MTSSLMGVNAVTDVVRVKEYTKDLKSLCEFFDRVTIMSYRCSVDRLISRFLYGREIGAITASLVLGVTDPDDYDLAIIVTDDPWCDLPERLKTVTTGVYFTQIEADWPLVQQSSLQDSDWLILRELERRFLSSSELHTKREAWRNEIDLEIEAGAATDEERKTDDPILAEGES